MVMVGGGHHQQLLQRIDVAPLHFPVLEPVRPVHGTPASRVTVCRGVAFVPLQQSTAVSFTPTHTHDQQASGTHTLHTQYSADFNPLFSLSNTLKHTPNNGRTGRQLLFVQVFSSSFVHTHTERLICVCVCDPFFLFGCVCLALNAASCPVSCSLHFINTLFKSRTRVL